MHNVSYINSHAAVYRSQHVLCIVQQFTQVMNLHFCMCVVQQQAIDYTAADTMDQLRKSQTSGMIREGFGRDADYSDED
jgi:hypothetical protein